MGQYQPLSLSPGERLDPAKTGRSKLANCVKWNTERKVYVAHRLHRLMDQARGKLHRSGTWPVIHIVPTRYVSHAANGTWAYSPALTDR